ncbi:hypothetical protein C8Q80DRAFT_1187631 [Daedaleopsis nitida]|nr:hypothetical protein C8Q80DRAFT_1187631 [Daedaleopsis nitida]
MPTGTVIALSTGPCMLAILAVLVAILWRGAEVYRRLDKIGAVDAYPWSWLYDHADEKFAEPSSESSVVVELSPIEDLPPRYIREPNSETGLTGGIGACEDGTITSGHSNSTLLAVQAERSSLALSQPACLLLRSSQQRIVSRRVEAYI